MRNFFVLAFFLFCSCCAIAQVKQQNISVRLFSSYRISSLNFFHITGNYVVYGDSVCLFYVDDISLLKLTQKDDSVWVEHQNLSSKYKSVKIVPILSNSSFKIKTLNPDYNPRTYDDELQVSAFGNTLKLINRVDIEKYVAGVVQWEVGTNNPQEFNKVKTVVIRTYALGNWRRHEEEGFQMCDEVHCQVFKGKTFNQNIYNAANATNEIILVDDSARIVNASFHSNCGGQTMNSEDVWSKALTCLRSVNDTFCLQKTNALWQKKIPKDLWLDYLKTKYNFPIENREQLGKVLCFNQPTREVYLISGKNPIPLKFIREDMKLKSTFFAIKEEGENIVFTGKGFGHGVGLCQEGAMHMAELGYSFSRIINFYYSNTHLVRFSQLDFFKSE